MSKLKFATGYTFQGLFLANGRRIAVMFFASDSNCSNIARFAAEKYAGCDMIEPLYTETFIEYEYHEEPSPTMERVVELGKQGWKFVSNIDGRYLFSREKKRHKIVPGPKEFK